MLSFFGHCVPTDRPVPTQECNKSGRANHGSITRKQVFPRPVPKSNQFYLSSIQISITLINCRIPLKLTLASSKVDFPYN